MSDYIIQAVNAYEEPVSIVPSKFKEELKGMIREELAVGAVEHFM